MRDSFFEKYKTSEVTNTRRVINTPSSFIKSNFLYIQEAGYLKSLRPHLSRRSGLSSYLFLIVLSGSGSVSYRDTAGSHLFPASDSPQDVKHPLTRVAARAGDCFFLDCSGEYTHISSEADPWELLWIHFYGPNAAAYYSCFREQHDWHFKSSHLAELTSTIQNVITLHEEKTDDADLLTAAQIVSILTTLCTDAPRESADDSPLSVKLKDILRYLTLYRKYLPRSACRPVLYQQVLSFQGVQKRIRNNDHPVSADKKNHQCQRAAPLQQRFH